MKDTLLDASIVIPTKNAGVGFSKVLDSVFSQKTSFDYEVICVDSGSSDETLQTIKKYPIRLYQIAPKEFGHGRTRNYGASKADGEFIIFITQDALPAHDSWLNNFICAMREDEDVVGGFGIHYPYPDCNIFDRRDLEAHFERFGSKNRIMYIDDPDRWDRDDACKHELCFFSDNNSCVRRSVFMEHPYPDVDYAEDQIWMRSMLELGYKKIYCPTAPVYHSHNYKGAELSKRYFDDYKGLYEIHEYMIAERKKDLLKLFKDLTVADIKYIRSLPIAKSEKIEALMLAISRNYRRCSAGYLGSNYHRCSPSKKAKLDNKMSQQKEQREA